MPSTKGLVAHDPCLVITRAGAVVDGGLERVVRVPLGLHLARDVLGPLEGAEHVATEDLANVLVAVVAAEELGHEHRVRGNIAEVLGERRDAVIVGAETNVVDASDVADVVNVIGEISRRAVGVRLDAAHKLGRKVDHHDTAILGNANKHIIGLRAQSAIDTERRRKMGEYAKIQQKSGQENTYHIARMIADAKGRAVAKDDGRAGNVQDVVHGLGGHVGDVNKHADAVHLEDDAAAKVGQAVVLAFKRARVDPGKVLREKKTKYEGGVPGRVAVVAIKRVSMRAEPKEASVRERHVASAKVIHLKESLSIQQDSIILLYHAKGGERVVDRVAALHAHQRGDAAVGVGSAHIGGGVRNLERLGIYSAFAILTNNAYIRVLGDKALGNVDLVHGLADVVGPRVVVGVARDVDAPELATNAALNKARDVRVERRLRRIEVHIVELIAVLDQQLPRQIIVAVYQKVVGDEPARTRHDILAARVSGHVS